MENETLIFYGDAVKALGEGRVGGYLVRYTSEQDPDLTGDFFSAQSDLGVEDGAKLPVYYEHGFDDKLKKRKIGTGTITVDEVGAWFEAQLKLRDDYEKAIYELAEAGKLGWSSGAAGHLVERASAGNANHILSWPIAEASLTPQPAEYRNTVLPVKSLFDTPAIPQAEVSDTGRVATDPGAQSTLPTPYKETETMEQTEKDEIKTLVADTLKAFLADTRKGDVQVLEDETDRSLKGNPLGAREFFQAVKTAGITGNVSPRLQAHQDQAIKATGSNEAIPSQGGFLVTQDIGAGIQSNLWSVGSLLSRFTAIPVSGNGIVLNAVDETSRAAGSRMGGIRGYWLEEGGTITASKPKFRQIALRLKKLAALCYATDELLDDAAALEGWLATNVPNELRFMAEDALINGTGLGQPLGIVASPALVQATRTDASEIDQDDLANMWKSRYLGANDYIWLINAECVAQLEKISLGNVPLYMPPGGLSGNPLATIKGRPVYETEYSAALGTLGDILLISPSHYALINKGGVQSASSIHVAFTTAETAFRFIYRVDGAPYWNSPVTPYKGSYTVSPFVGLKATT